VNAITRIRAVFDCNIFLQAIGNKNSPASACFRLAEQNVIQLFVSDETLTELDEVLNRPFIKNRFGLADETINEFIGNLRKLAKVFSKVPRAFSLPRDVDDEPYINLAVECEADYIITRDKDLLDLMTGYNEESKSFRQKFRPLSIVQPLEFLSIVEEKVKEIRQNSL